MIIDRAFYREAAQTTGAIVLVLMVVLVMFGLTAILGRVAKGDYAEDIVFQLVGWQTLRRLDLLLPLALYLGVLLTFSRWYRDSEMAVLAACGVGLVRLLKPVLLLSAAIALIVTWVAFYLTPLSSRALEEVKNDSAQRSGYSGVSPGAFTDAGPDGRILYAESVNDRGEFGRVFVSHPVAGRARVILARAGLPFVDEKTGDHFVALLDGWAYEGVPGRPDYRIVHFEQYAVRLNLKPVAPMPASTEALPTTELLERSDREAAAEWQWRLSKPLSVFLLAIYGVVLSYTDARRGRLANLFIAILVYFIYSNLLGIGQTLMKKGQMPPGAGLWWVHVLMGSVVFYLFWRRNRHRPLLPQLRLRPLRAVT
jgi:lipopolysaccharide export system permease protein